MIPAYCLVCSELPERTTACKEHFAIHGVDATFWRAFHGKTFGLRTTHEYEPGKTLPQGHVGLNCSFWALCQHIHLTGQENDADPNQPVLILEDDVRFPDDFPGALRGVNRDLESSFPDWDLVFLGLTQHEPHVWNFVTERIGPPNSRLLRLNDPFGTHALMIRRRAFPVLLEHMAIAQRNLDQQLYARVLKPGHLKWCAVLPSIVEQRTADYGKGIPEWLPSCVDVLPKTLYVEVKGDSEPQEVPGIRLHATEARHMAGGLGMPTDLPGRPTPELIKATLALTDRVPCGYRGEPLEDDGITAYGRTIPVTQCARLNKPCHDRIPKNVGVVKVPDWNLEVIACETCSHRIELSSPGKRPRLPVPAGHFNCSMIEWQGRVILSTRDSWGHSKIGLWELTNAKSDWSGEWFASPISSLASDHPEAPRLEDGRLFHAPHPDTGKPSLHAALSLPDGYPPKVVQVGYVRFADDLQAIEHTTVFRSPTQSLYEKNWMPFYCERAGLNWIYQTKPDHIVMGDDQQTWSTPNDLPWTGGVIRGGCPPVFVPDSGIDGGSYYHWTHGCLKRISGNIYTVGLTVFERYAPFRVLRQTATPVIWPSAPGAEENVVKRNVVFPGGAILHAGYWHIAAGIDDCHCRIFRISMKDAEKLLTSIPERQSDKTTTIRETPIAKGILAMQGKS